MHVPIGFGSPAAHAAPALVAPQCPTLRPGAQNQGLYCWDVQPARLPARPTRSLRNSQPHRFALHAPILCRSHGYGVIVPK